MGLYPTDRIYGIRIGKAVNKEFVIYFEIKSTSELTRTQKDEAYKFYLQNPDMREFETYNRCYTTYNGKFEDLGTYMWFSMQIENFIKLCL